MRQELFKLIKEHAYKYREEPFSLASGRKSRHYFNCKEITMHPERLELLCRYIVEDFLPKTGLPDPESFGGLTLGADPICYGLGFEYRRQGKNVFPMIVRKQVKEHGTKNLVEGAIHMVRSCFVVDDVVTTGGSTSQAIKSLRDAGLIVNYGICILDREEGGREAIESEGVKMHSLFKKSEFGNLE
ncbi:orotate phosphoribosyltransferase [Leptospira perolatii]|uniref:Orotate phosphoribosyltransferase n=1 Tax=Leptospira perolatii TaxID=2023191 RepID=A0A2M9ZQ41_9LEPT|nr:orotate phosphoribosyltransferase [Leptospira perolatii]PJZ68239.1 orotate phosphoribosyltransferase [Leptospira perolatii]PJZ74164.1 orotate phosphoribosyltransferase [Leptospira perolatii]